MHCLKKLREYSRPLEILLDADTLSPLQQETINLSLNLSLIAQMVTVLPHLCSSSIISLGKICDSNCTIVMNDKKLYAVKSSNINIKINNNDIIITGTQNLKDGLYDIPFNKTTMQENKYVFSSLHPI